MDTYGNQLVNTKETKLLCISSSNLAEMLILVRGWTLLILEVKGQGHSGQMEISCEPNTDLNVCFVIELGRHINHGKPY